jgi:hypothetical protein
MREFDYQLVLKTGGCLTACDKLEMAPAMGWWFLGYIGGLAMLILRAVPTSAAVSVSTIPRPAGPLANETDAVYRNMPSAMQAHAYRTWLIGAGLAALQGSVSLDAELLYCSALLHDYGLTLSTPTGTDFTLASAERAGRCASAAGISASRKRALMDAICLHSTIGLSKKTSEIGYFVQWGSMGDLAGVRRWRLGRQNLNYIDQRMARTAAARDKLIELVRKESISFPKGRFALYTHAGMTLMMRINPTRA